MLEKGRREFVALLGGAAAWPLAARAQQTPVIGFLDSRSPDVMADQLCGFRQGLKSAGYAEGENVSIVYRWAEDRTDRLPMLAAELARPPVAVTVASGEPDVIFALKAATTTIPILLGIGGRDSPGPAMWLRG
jgi:putative ABC transport system substrate-binding protein